MQPIILTCTSASDREGESIGSGEGLCFACSTGCSGTVASPSSHSDFNLVSVVVGLVVSGNGLLTSLFDLDLYVFV